MANDSIAESFAIRGFIRTSGALFAKGAEAVPAGARDSPEADLMLCS
ncbi:hypothetical protein MKX54_13340 [Alkalihalobacillus sp. FSL R5-0424]